ncbi:MAG: hypothetical protein ACREOU_16100 [Candidatus Eiseniibacteriota bacterium]
MTRGQRVVTMAAVILATTSAIAQAAPLSSEALDNATVQPAGPRSGVNGKAFFNIEGSANGTFASYGVADFSFGVLPDAVIAINSIAIELVQSNAAFSAAGDVVFSLDTSASLADIQPGGTSPLAFDGADPGTATDVSQGDLTLLPLGGGPHTYTPTANGDVNAYTFPLVVPTVTALMNRLNSNSTIRVVVGTATATLAGTWAGATNSTFAGPTLKLDVTFDPGVPSQPESWGRIKASYR